MEKKERKKLNYERSKEKEKFQSKHAIGISINIYLTLFYLFSCVLFDCFKTHRNKKRER